MFILEGNIGAGKSTFLKLMAQLIPGITVSFEPLHQWQGKLYGQSLLANFYENPHRWAYTMETLAMMCRAQEHLKDQEQSQHLLVERSIYSGHYCFATNGYTQGFMTKSEWAMYMEFFNMLIAGRCLPPTGFIYLKVNPEIAYERLRRRNRHAEKQVSLAYLKQIDACHEAFLIQKQDVLEELKTVPLLVLDCNDDFEENTELLQQHAERVQSFMGLITKEQYEEHDYSEKY